MTDNMENEQIEVTPAENDEPILPVGWDGVGDIFEASSWADPTAVGLEGFAAAQTPIETEPAEETPAIESEPEGTEGGTAESETKSESESEPASEPAAPPKLKFRTQFNHQDMDVELDEAELPTIYQKSLALDRERERVNKAKPVVDMASKLAAQMGFDTPEAMLEAASANYRQSEIDALVKDGVHKTVAEAIVNQRLAAAKAAELAPATVQENSAEPEQAAQNDAPAAPAPAKRDFRNEAAELLRIRPELAGKQLPEEVQQDAIKNGVRLSTAYLNYETQQIKAENDKLKKTNKIHEQNAASAARAPVTGTNGGGATDTAPEDPFLIGFNSGY